jgi:hypothetical protein
MSESNLKNDILSTTKHEHTSIDDGDDVFTCPDKDKCQSHSDFPEFIDINNEYSVNNVLDSRLFTPTATEWNFFP